MDQHLETWLNSKPIIQDRVLALQHRNSIEEDRVCILPLPKLHNIPYIQSTEYSLRVCNTAHTITGCLGGGLSHAKSTGVAGFRPRHTVTFDAKLSGESVLDCQLKGE